MEKYKVIIKEEYIRTIEVEAVDKAEALDKIIKQYSNEDIVLDTDDFFDVEFEVVGNK
ncbi:MULTISPECIES: DpnD/PcfM family protein [unclassified Granulicatella]|uniref:DpnD/PcfM family protein n=1 Tax=unclassified Granulicatella TaxID=2630493 RepID=UPI000AF66AA6|nr:MULTISPECIES: DpnD/PcfM family protein [unclassified Granulicatella]